MCCPIYFIIKPRHAFSSPLSPDFSPAYLWISRMVAMAAPRPLVDSTTTHPLLPIPVVMVAVEPLGVAIPAAVAPSGGDALYARVIPDGGASCAQRRAPRGRLQPRLLPRPSRLQRGALAALVCGIVGTASAKSPPPTAASPPPTAPHALPLLLGRSVAIFSF